MTVRSHSGEPDPGRGEPARDPRFLGYLAGAALADVGDQAWIVILAYAAAQTGDPLTATLTVAAGTVPRAILDLVGGAVADRLPTQRLLALAAAGRVLVLLLGLLFLAQAPQNTIWIMAGVAIFFGAADALHKPAIATLPRQLVPVGQLVKAIGYRQLAGRTALLVGPAVAGVVLSAWALPGSIAGLVVLFAAAAVLLAVIRTRYQRERAPRQSVIAATRQVIDYLRVDESARALNFTMIGLNFFVTPVVNAGVALRAHSLGWGPHTLGLLIAGIGVGAVIGTLIALRLKPTYPMRFALIMLIGQGAGIALSGVLPLVGSAIALCFVGFTAGISSPMLGGTTQAIIKESYLGRIYALQGLADDALIPFALIGYGAMAGWIGVTPTTVICGLAMAALMAVSLLRRPLRNLRIDLSTTARSADADDQPTGAQTAADRADQERSADPATDDDRPADADDAGPRDGQPGPAARVPEQQDAVPSEAFDTVRNGEPGPRHGGKTSGISGLPRHAAAGAVAADQRRSSKATG
ncbi:MFS transporter [Microlunatus soli]|uniref:Predicted arabinose efflux permease, MFS family n=1 Tax=Microlunatus soli TaxID=630515 RepID=A0A1H1WL83_9ACTN|nr:MFS transporter [Microlunatus soli]SDS97440.1 Predicted arabinose efflux permease, MFS family [Microlunatus soli]